jgi:hypothetical protein
MKLSEYRQTYQEFSGLASSASRQLAFAGIAIIWIFQREANALHALPISLVFPLMCMAIALACDLLQYVVSAAVWGIFHRVHERNAVLHDNEDPEVSAHPGLNWPGIIFYWSKLTMVLVGYLTLINYLLNEIIFL